MATEKVFVCDSKNERFAQFLQENELFCQEFEQKIEFLKKQADGLSEKRKNLWEGLFNSLKDQELIPKTYKHGDYKMTINQEAKQLFIEKETNQGGFADFLKHILK